MIKIFSNVDALMVLVELMENVQLVLEVQPLIQILKSVQDVELISDFREQLVFAFQVMEEILKINALNAKMITWSILMDIVGFVQLIDNGTEILVSVNQVLYKLMEFVFSNVLKVN